MPFVATVKQGRHANDFVGTDQSKALLSSRETNSPFSSSSFPSSLSSVDNKSDSSGNKKITSLETNNCDATSGVTSSPRISIEGVVSDGLLLGSRTSSMRMTKYGVLRPLPVKNAGEFTARKNSISQSPASMFRCGPKCRDPFCLSSSSFIGGEGSPTGIQFCMPAMPYEGDGSDDTSVSSLGSDKSAKTFGSLVFAQQGHANNTMPQGRGNALDELLKVSNAASMLCVLDCTILPVLTVVMPLFGIVAGSPAQMEWLHAAGHKMALFFVLPVGGLATCMNLYRSHRKLWIASIGWIGMALVFCANSGGDVGACHAHHHYPHAVASEATTAWSSLIVLIEYVVSTLHHGAGHRIANLTGCALLLASNYLSHRFGTASVACGFPECNRC